MSLLWRVLDPVPCLTLDQYVAQGGGRALDEARRVGADAVIATISDSGLRGRGGAGFPTGTKWRTVADSESTSTSTSTSVIVNGAEGEPGTFKDRALLRANPYKVIEGALIAAVAVDATEVVIALKASFEREVALVRRALDEVELAGWSAGLTTRVVEGPSSYLFGEETALLEVVDGRQPFPRVDPPFRRGIGPDAAHAGHGASQIHLAAVGGTDAPPALVNNVETMANVAGIIHNGPAWFRSVGTDRSPGTLLCTITGHTRQHAVGEVAMGTPLREVISLIGGGPLEGRTILGVLSGVANPILPTSRLDTPVTFEDMANVGSGLGAGGFIVFSDRTDMIAVAHGAARFLAVESCGQCEPCKRDGIAIAEHLEPVAGPPAERDVDDLRSRLETVVQGARCTLASQQQRVVGSILDLFGDELDHRPPSDDDAARFVLPLVDIVDGRAVFDTSHRTKQPDWTHDPHDSGSWPAARLGNQPLTVEPPLIHEDLSARRMDAIVAGANPVEGAFPVVIGIHEHLETLLGSLRSADAASRPDILHALADALRSHIDVTQRILYPMVQRVAGASGDDASWTAEHAERAGLQLVDTLSAAASTPPSDVEVHELARDLRAHIETEERSVIPLLVGNMTSDELDSLADALGQARSEIV